MTSQIEVNMDELKAEAKALNVAGWQATKDPQKLMQKIEEAKNSGTERSTAPKLRVAGMGGSSRTQMIAQLEKEDPSCKYMTQSSKLTPAEADAKGIEIVKKPNGDILHCGEDIICRTDKESYVQWQQGRTDHQLKSMRSIDKDLKSERGGKKIQAVTERAKQGFEPE